MPHLIVAESSGQLGNQLFLFAHLFSVARELNVSLHNPPFNKYRRHFLGPAEGHYASFTAQEPAGRSKVLELISDPNQERIINYSARMIRRCVPSQNQFIQHLTCKGVSPEYDIDVGSASCMKFLRNAPITFLFGWRFRSYDLFKKHSPSIKEYFRFSDNETADQFIRNLRQEHDFVLAVHVRQGDYKEYMDGSFFLSLQEYGVAIRSVLSSLEVRNPAVVILSNSNQDLSSLDDVTAIHGPGDAISDMQVMSMSDMILAVPSTFSRWASFVGEVPLCYIDRDSFCPRIDPLNLPSPARV